jgi:hypothetical protein
MQPPSQTFRHAKAVGAGSFGVLATSRFVGTASGSVSGVCAASAHKEARLTWPRFAVCLRLEEEQAGRETWCG